MPPERKKKYVQHYVKKWEKEEEFKDWLAPDPAGEMAKAYCKYCKSTLNAHKRDLMKHSSASKHINILEREKAAKSSKKLPFQPTKTQKEKDAELRVAVFIAEHCSLRCVDHLANLLPKIGGTAIKIHRTKCSMLIKNVIAPCMLNDVISDIGNSPFSAIIDESTDVSTVKVLCVMLKYYSKSKKSVVTTFYRVMQLFGCDANAIKDEFISQLKNDGLILSNLIGIGVDNANVMAGSHHSLSSLLKKDVPNLLTIRCICHSLHLCAEKASEVLPRQLEYLVRESHNWFSYSSKRRTEYEQLYAAMNDSKKPQKISKLSGTRWLARFDAVTTIVKQWDELHLLFQIAKEQDKCHAAGELFAIFHCGAYKVYMTFLKLILKEVCSVNKLFQSESVEPLKLFEDLFFFYKKLLRKIVVPTRLERISDTNLISFEFEKYLMASNAVEFGYEFHKAVEEVKLPAHETQDVKNRCLKFLTELCIQIRYRLPKNLSLLQQVSIFDPSIATSQQKPSIVKVAKLFGFNEDEISEAETQWQNIANKKWNNTTDSVVFWSEVDCDVDAANIPRFSAISKLAFMCLCIPLSNATVERAFSIHSIVKNKLRNRLAVATMQGIMTVRYFLLRENITCVEFVPSSDMRKKFNQTMYDHINVENDETYIFENILEAINH